MYRIIAVYIIVCIIVQLMQYVRARNNDFKLKFVQIVFRHGIRTPLLTYPTNPYNATYWDQYGGFGQLTPEGMNQMHDFGVYLKKHYSSFVTQNYHPSKIKVRSTNTDCVIQSASTLLAGLYQPNEKQKWKRDWLPIPVYNNELKYEETFIAEDCPKYQNKKQDMLKSEPYKSIERENWDLLKKISKLSNITEFDLSKISIIADNYLVAKAINLQSPLWVIEHKEKLLELYDHTMKFQVYTEEMAKLVSGSLLNSIIINIERVMKNEKKWELFLFSSHDYYINGLIKLLNMGSIRQSNFGAALFFELYECTRMGGHFIKVYYKNNPENSEIKLEHLKIEGCGELCPLEKFYKLTADKIVSDKEKYCKL